MTSTPTLTKQQLQFLQHSLGCDEYGRGSMYRNHFVTDECGADGRVCLQLVAIGLMSNDGPRQLCGGMSVFHVTEQGIEAMRAQSPAPPPPKKLTRSQRRYDEYMKADPGMDGIQEGAKGEVMTETDTKFEEWAVVEIMGRKRFAGFVSEHAMGGTSFVRVDVPAIALPNGDVLPPFTKLFGAASIYCISPCTEETAKAFAATIRSESFARYEAPRLEAPRASDPDLLQSPDEEHFCEDCGVEIRRGTLCADCEQDRDEWDELPI